MYMLLWSYIFTLNTSEHATPTYYCQHPHSLPEDFLRMLKLLCQPERQVGCSKILMTFDQKLTEFSVTSPFRWANSEAHIIHCLPDFLLKT